MVEGKHRRNLLARFIACASRTCTECDAYVLTEQNIEENPHVFAAILDSRDFCFLFVCIVAIEALSNLLDGPDTNLPIEPPTNVTKTREVCDGTGKNRKIDRCTRVRF